MSDISNDKLYEVLLDIKGDMGAVKASVANGHEFTKAVSAKADVIRGELREHVESQEAHGLAGEQKAKGNIFPWVIAGMGILGPIVWELIRGGIK